MGTNKSTEPKFKVGDVVEVSARNPVPEREGEKLGIITFIEEGADITQYTSKPRKGEFYAYHFECFDQDFIDSAPGSWLRLCKGIRNKELCFDCECYEICPKSILNCRTEGRLVVKRCEKCKYRFKCWTQ